VVLVVGSLPKDTWSRKVYGANLLRHWYASARLFERTSLLMLSTEGVVEVVVAPRCTELLRDNVAKHFTMTAMDLMRLPEAMRAAGDPMRGLSRFDECALKLVFYVSFMIRSRATLSMLSMRLLSMCMMLFMFMTMTVQRRQQFHRYEMYYAGRYGDGGPFRRRPTLFQPIHLDERDDFWDQFETGRLGYHAEREAARSRTHMVLQLLAIDQMLTRMNGNRGGEYEDEYEEGDFEDQGYSDGEPEDPAFYAEERHHSCRR